ncbi:MAG: hypothetical protein JXM70_23345, partial [Pirellulales bacterium]|nr:hypothetical protein [Pirellulales bacterium]
PDGLLLKRWIASGEAQVVRRRGRRTVYRVALSRQDRSFFVKYDRYGSLADLLRNLIRGSAARREWWNAREALRRGVSTALPVALCEEIRAGVVRDSFYVSEEIRDAWTLDQFVVHVLGALQSEEKARQRRQVVEGLAKFVANLHEVGLEHGDFHAGNILVQTGPRFFLVDMSAARFGQPLNWPASRANLTVLCAEWFDRTTFVERWRFWRAYKSLRPDLVAPDDKEVVEQFDLLRRDYSRRIDRRRDRRAMRTNRDFYVLKKTRANAPSTKRQNNLRVHAIRDFPPDELDELLACPDALLWENLDRPVKLGHSSVMVRATLRLDHGPQAVSYKRFRAKNRWKAFLNLFRSSRALRGWRLGHALISRGIATPRPIMVCEPSGLNPSAIVQPWQERAAYLATEWIDGARNLHIWAWSLKEQTRQERFRLAALCAGSLGRLLGRMHARQISHGDLKGSNVLVVEHDDGYKASSLKTLLIDLDGVRIHKRLPHHRQVADLARLATSAAGHAWAGNTLRMRFLRAYESEFPRGTVCRKDIWRAVAKKSGKQIAKKQQRGDAVL